MAEDPGEGTAAARSERVKLLLALEVARITRDLEVRIEFLVTVWSRHRRREVFLDTAFSRWRTVAFSDLVELDPPTIAKVQRFYDELETFRAYVAYTEDMPQTLREQIEILTRRMRRAADPALEALGGLPEGHVPVDLPEGPLDLPGEG